MAIVKRGNTYYTYIDPFKKGKLIGLKVDVTTKSEAKQIEGVILRACRSGNYSGLDPVSKETCIRLFENQGWEMPEELAGERKPKERLTLWKASELFYKYPGIKDSPSLWRYEFCLVHLAEKLGQDTPIKSIWVPELKRYQADRLDDGASPSTINWELATLSKLFGVLIEKQLVESNPVRLVKRLSTKSGERQVYLAFSDVSRITDECPEWFRPMILTAYYTGMRRGEILGLTRKQVNLKKRLITLSPQDTKEAHWKRVPIHQDLVSILEEVLRVTCLGTDKVFLLKDGPNIRPLELETFKNPWPRACEALEEKKLMKKPFPRLHDLRATWKTNARRSGMDPEIREAILGHAERGKSVVERYGRISDQELLKAIDGMTFDHGETQILVAREKPKASEENLNKTLTAEGSKRKSGSGR